MRKNVRNMCSSTIQMPIREAAKQIPKQAPSRLRENNSHGSHRSCKLDNERDKSSYSKDLICSWNLSNRVLVGGRYIVKGEIWFKGCTIH